MYGGSGMEPARATTVGSSRRTRRVPAPSGSASTGSPTTTTGHRSARGRLEQRGARGQATPGPHQRLPLVDPVGRSGSTSSTSARPPDGLGQGQAGGQDPGVVHHQHVAGTAAGRAGRPRWPARGPPPGARPTTSPGPTRSRAALRGSTGSWAMADSGRP